jgi:hypothetical protein
MLIPKGTYRGVLAGPGALAFALSGNKGTENAQIQMRFTAGPPEVVGQARTWFGYMTDGAWERTVEVLRHLYPDWVSDELRDLRAIAARQPHPIEVELVIEHETDKDNVLRDKLSWINVPRVFGNAMDDATLDAFSSRWKTSVATVKPPRGAPPAPAPGETRSGTSTPPRATRAAGFGGDEIPPPSDQDRPPDRGRGGHPFGGG